MKLYNGRFKRIVARLDSARQLSRRNASKYSRLVVCGKSVLRTMQAEASSCGRGPDGGIAAMAPLHHGDAAMRHESLVMQSRWQSLSISVPNISIHATEATSLAALVLAVRSTIPSIVSKFPLHREWHD